MNQGSDTITFMLNRYDLTRPEELRRFKLAVPMFDWARLLLGWLPGWVEWTFIHPTTHHVIVRWAHTQDWDELAAVADEAAALNDQGYGVFIGTCTRRSVRGEGQRGRAQDAWFVPALWVDIDGRDDLDPLLTFTPLPSIVLHSGGGVHAYWLLRRPAKPTEDVKRMLRGLAVRLGGDTAVADFARVMRVMGSINTKPGRNGARVLIEHWRPDLTYTLDAFKPFAHAEPAPRQVQVPDTLKLDVPRWIEDLLAAPPGEGERNDTLFRMAAWLKDANWDEPTVQSLLRGFAGLPEREVEKTIRSAFNREKRPIAAPQALWGAARTNR